MKRITKSDEELIFQTYLKFKSVAETKKETNFSKMVIYRTLKLYNFDLSNSVRIFNKKAKRKYFLNENYFEEINSRDKAYITGLLHSDGHLNKKNRLSIKLTDKEILEEISKRVYLNFRPLPNDSNTKPEHKQNYTFTITSDKIYEDCRKHGCIENKTYNLEFPITIPDKFLPDYIRGFFDGDGWVTHQKSKTGKINLAVGFMATKKWCEGLNSYLNKLGIFSSIYKNKKIDNRVATIMVNRQQDILLFYELIYTNLEKELYLNRKFIKFNNLIKEKYGNY